MEGFYVLVMWVVAAWEGAEYSRMVGSERMRMKCCLSWEALVGNHVVEVGPLLVVVRRVECGSKCTLWGKGRTKECA